jgi:hypothetical protein
MAIIACVGEWKKQECDTAAGAEAEAEADADADAGAMHEENCTANQHSIK